jgi:hypothetical protein
MAEERLRAELAESKAELQRVRNSMSVGNPILHKDMSLITLVPMWDGSESAGNLEEFLTSIDTAARIGNWQDNDKMQIAALKLSGSAKLFHQECNELHLENVNWQTFKEAFRRRYEDVRTDQFHFTCLQSARQGKKESPQEFADRCRALAQKLIVTAGDPIAQRIHRENADRMLLASFVSGLAGTPGRQTRYANPQSLGEALKIALSLQEVERQQRFNEAFYACHL